MLRTSLACVLLCIACGRVENDVTLAPPEPAAPEESGPDTTDANAAADGLGEVESPTEGCTAMAPVGAPLLYGTLTAPPAIYAVDGPWLLARGGGVDALVTRRGDTVSDVEAFHLDFSSGPRVTDHGRLGREEPRASDGISLGELEATTADELTPVRFLRLDDLAAPPAVDANESAMVWFALAGGGGRWLLSFNEGWRTPIEQLVLDRDGIPLVPQPARHLDDSGVRYGRGFAALLPVRGEGMVAQFLHDDGSFLSGDALRSAAVDPSWGAWTVIAAGWRDDAIVAGVYVPGPTPGASTPTLFLVRDDATLLAQRPIASWMTGTNYFLVSTSHALLSVQPSLSGLVPAPSIIVQRFDPSTLESVETITYTPNADVDESRWSAAAFGDTLVVSWLRPIVEHVQYEAWAQSFCVPVAHGSLLATSPPHGPNRPDPPPHQPTPRSRPSRSSSR